jgi:O-methyltransferase involved in polyketide biosynthesis
MAGTMNSTEITFHGLSNGAETLIIPLYLRAMESQRPDALLKEDRAVALVQQMGNDISQLEQAQVGKEVRVAFLMRSREFDRYARDLLARHPEAAVVHVGCGFDVRFERVDNGRVEWYELAFEGKAQAILEACDGVERV